MLSIVWSVGVPSALLTVLLGALLWIRLDTVWSEEQPVNWLKLFGVALGAGVLATLLYVVDPAGQPIQPAFATAVLAALGWWIRLRGWRNETA